MRFLLTCRLPNIRPEQILAGRENVQITLPLISTDVETGSFAEHTVLATLACILRPRRCFEIGTSLGITTAIIASNCPAECIVDTLDISNEPRIGSFFRTRPESCRIRQHVAPSTSFDFTPFTGQVDLVLVDGSHDYRDVSRDIASVFQILSPRGVALWHDVGPDWPGVSKALQDCQRADYICRLEGTSFGFYAVPQAEVHWKK